MVAIGCQRRHIRTIFRKLFGFGGPASRDFSADLPAVPKGTRVYAVGDIHGSLELLREMHELIEQDSRVLQPERLVLIYLGDYVDLGEKTRETLDYLIDEPLKGFERIYLRGNHEEFLLNFLEDASLAPMWLPNGGDTTLLSYGVGLGDAANAEERYRDMQTRLGEAIPERHLEFVRSLETYHVEGDYLFVHAGVRPGVPLESQTGQDLLWIRDEFMTSDENHEYCVVHGHTIVPEADFRANRISVDTGAYYSGMLSCAVLEDDDRRIIHT